MKKLIIIVALLSGACSMGVDVSDSEHTVTVEHKIDFEFVKELCEAKAKDFKFPNADAKELFIKECEVQEIKDLLDVLERLEDKTEEQNGNG